MISDKTSVVYKEALACWNYFYDNFSRKDASYGMMLDRYPDQSHISSIAGTGFFLASLIAGCQMGFIGKQEGRTIALRALNTLATLHREEGFYYHFYNTVDLSRFNQCELSTIDTALLIAGAIAVGQYFGGDVLTLAQQLYDQVNWQYFLDKQSGLFHMAKYDSGFHAYWDVSAEQLVLYVLAGGATNVAYRIDKQCYYSFKRLDGEYGQYKFIHGWFGSLFTHQFSHAFIDFEGLVDENGTDWFDNSRIATLANRQFCIDEQDKHIGYGENSWGLTACATKYGYEGRIGAPPSGNDNIEHISDGTIAPAGAIGSIVFCPQLSISAMQHYETVTNLVGKYGFTDAYNADIQWVSQSYISIDKGISLLMIANHYDKCITKAFCSNANICNSLAYLGFKPSIKEV